MLLIGVISRVETFRAKPMPKFSDIVPGVAAKFDLSDLEIEFVARHRHWPPTDHEQ
jgi:hypothetical protein